MPYRYRVAESEVELDEHEELVAVRYSESLSRAGRAHLAERCGLGAAFDVPGEAFTLVGAAGAGSEEAQPQEETASAVRLLGRQREVARVAPVFRLGGSLCLASDRVLVRLEDGARLDPAEVARHDGVECHQNGSELTLRLHEQVDPIERAYELSACDGVVHAEPDLVTVGARLPRHEHGRLADPLLSLQYAVMLTEADRAWGIQAGDPDVLVAVLDEGVDERHPDLAKALRGSYDAVFGGGSATPELWDAHGTGCAGLAVAVPGNDRGIRGISNGCSLLAVRVAYSKAQNRPWVTRSSWLARGIDWAWRHGADVLNLSWGDAAPSQRVIDAIERARLHGRNGLGCVVVAAAGNHGGGVDFPARLEGVLAVSASNQIDEFKSWTSQDFEGWASCAGPEVDLAAPGVANVTTDNVGPAGVDRGNYRRDFNGTSASAAIVSGAAALVLSAARLTEQDVRDILRASTDKAREGAGAPPYVGGRNDQLGFGRLNVHAAVITAQVRRGAVLGAGEARP